MGCLFFFFFGGGGVAFFGMLVVSIVVSVSVQPISCLGSVEVTQSRNSNGDYWRLWVQPLGVYPKLYTLCCVLQAFLEFLARGDLGLQSSQSWKATQAEVTWDSFDFFSLGVWFNIY